MNELDIPDEFRGKCGMELASRLRSFLTLALAAFCLVGCRERPTMSKQPIPKVSDADVSRIVLRDFGAAQGAEAEAVLAGYGKGEGERDPARVRLAILKLAAGDLEILQKHTETACRDYRDVIAWAEYPGYAELPFDPQLTNEVRAKAIADDWKRYQDWLTRK